MPAAPLFPPSPIKRALAQAHVLGPGRPLNFLGRGGRRFAAIKVELLPLRGVKLWGRRILRSLRRQLRKNTCDTATQLQAHLTLTHTFNACCLRQHGAKLLPTDGPELRPPLVSDLADRCMPESRESTRAHRGQGHTIDTHKIGRAHVRTPVTEKSRMPSSA